MRKRIVTLILATTIHAALGYDFSGNSFVSIKPPFQTASPEKEALWHYDWLDKCEGDRCRSMEIVPLGGRTFGDDLGRFLGYFGKTRLRVIEYKAGTDSAKDFLQTDKDLEARHFNIETKDPNGYFESIIAFKPVHEFVGAGIAWRQRITDCYWGEVSFPILQVTNKVDFEEIIVSDGDGPVDEIGLDGLKRVGSVTEALESGGWKLGRWDPNKEHTQTGIGDIEIKFGWETYVTEKAHLRSYLGGVFPTGNQPNKKLFFPPVVGNNQHYGIMFGSNMGFEVWCNGEHKVRQIIDTMGRYLFPNEQYRAFDLFDKEWSRYQEIYESEEAAQAAALGNNSRSGTSGINVFMRDVIVKPRFSSTINTAMVYSYCDRFIAEVGYNFFARQGEEIEFREGDVDTGASIKHVNGEGLTSLSRNIKDNFADDNVPVEYYRSIKTCDFNINAAAHPPMISQIFYGAIGYETSDWACPTSISLGGSYEWAHNSAGLSRWMAWGKLALCF